MLESEPAWQQVLEEVRAFLDDRPAAIPKGSAPGQGHGLLVELTARELDVLKLIRLGYSNAEIGAELVITPNTEHRGKSREEHPFQDRDVQPN